MSAVSAPVLPSVPSESPLFSDTGDAAIARRYLEWAEREYAAGRAAQALAAMERGADYAAASSDISFFLAKLRSTEGRSRFLVLEACNLALETDRFEYYSSEDARLLGAKTLSELRRFEEALNILERCDSEKYETHYCRLLALRGLVRANGDETELLRAFAAAMDRFPRETGPVRLLFDYAAGVEPEDALRQRDTLRQLIDLALRRLPILAGSDPELAYMAAPFMWNREEARRSVGSYRALGNPNPASLPIALNLGIIPGMQAVEELFAFRHSAPNTVSMQGQAVLNRELIAAVNDLLRSDDERNYLRRNLLQYSGVIMEDRDNDGIGEVWTTYHEGMIREYRYDADQDGEADAIITFAQGIPSFAEIILAAGTAPSSTASSSSEKEKALLRWERYPAVLNAELGEKRYIPRPLDYFFTPVRFTPLVFGGPDYPEWEDSPITERSLLSFAIILEQPSADFPGETERVELSNGLPVKATVFVGGRKASETEFRLGRPVIQYVDLDLDGRMETTRRYDPDVPYRILSTERDGE